MVSFPARPADDPEPLKPHIPSRERTQPVIQELASQLQAQGIHSTDLVLDLVLHDLADEARQAVGATGAAVALERDGELVCRAAAGPTAPDLGVRIHTEAGLSGLCVKQGTTQICDDTECDDRVDAEACRRLGVRSIVVIPLFSEREIIGIFEVFSARPNAHTAEDVQKLESLACAAARTVQATRTKSVASGETEINSSSEFVSEPVPTLSVSSIMEKVHPVDPAVRVLRWLVIGLAIPLLVLIGFDLGWHRMRSPGPVRVPEEKQLPDSEPQPERPPAGSTASPTIPTTSEDSAPKPTSHDNFSSGGLIIYQSGKVVYREFARVPGKKTDSPQGQTAAKGVAIPGASSAELAATTSAEPTVSRPAGTTGGRLLKSVSPQYPAEAILNKRGGAVVLHGTVGQDGRMHEIKIVSGDPLLTAAALDAVEQWQYEPYQRNGKLVDMPIDITIVFNAK
jgi:TonB family protein